ncbi:MAG: nitric oxide reductase [Calditrichaeota bacterium]|nr:MAG: nitric oxide reductase [Calditrichota bacterium]MBL1206082.1 nitric oxide reductase [Calditrichota bacterium]NOG45908.1 nitric oxide reductase [Calditrichota bacterium]
METTVQKENYKNIFYPPGGILIWMIITLEVLTFAIALFAFAIQRIDNLEMFNSSRQQLNILIGTINTIVLLSSGFFMAESLHKLKKGENKKSQFRMIAAIALGTVFLVLKAIEFNTKIEQGIGLEHNLFFTFYWLLTGFHFIHVFIGLIILIYLFIKIKNGYYNKENYFDVETGGAFWHMCDLIWMMLFPVLYLLH